MKIAVILFLMLAGIQLCFSLTNSSGTIENIYESGISTATNSSGYSIADLQGSLKSSTGFRNWGYVMIGCGIPIAVIGVVLVASSGGQTSYQYNYNANSGRSTETGSLPGAVGAIMAVAGIALGATGTVFAIIGSNKVNYYNNEIKNFKSALRLEMNFNKIELVYNF